MLTDAGSFSSAIASFDIKTVTQETLAALLVDLAGTKVLALLVQKYLLSLKRPSPPSSSTSQVQKYLLYWYKSTCCAGTKVLAVLAQKHLLQWHKSTCFTGTKALALLAQKHSLYWHKSTCFTGTSRQETLDAVVLELAGTKVLALLAQKYRY
jgi:hypothetical protein